MITLPNVTSRAGEVLAAADRRRPLLHEVGAEVEANRKRGSALPQPVRERRSL